MKGLLIQEFKTLFKSPAALSILIIPLVLMIGLGYLLPAGWIVPSAITIGIVGTVLLYFGGSLEEIKRTSFMKSISLTKLNKFTFLSTKILFSIIISLFSVLWVLFFAWMFTDVIPFLATDFSHIIVPGNSNVTDLGSAISHFIAGDSGAIYIVSFIPFKVDWNSIDWVLMLYAGAITIIVSISIAFIFVTFSKSSLSFYLMSFGYLLAMILFGGVVMPSFLISKDNGWFKDLYYIVPNFYTNNVMAASFGNGLGPTVSKLVNSLDSKEDMTALLEQVLNSSLVHPYVIKLIDIINTTTAKDAWNYINTNIDTIKSATGWDGTIHISSLLTLNFNKTWANAGVLARSTFSGVWETLQLLTSKGPDSFINTISSLVGPILFNTIKSNDQIVGLLNTINGMFNTAQAHDYYVPWIETVVLLGISVKFFRWS